MESITTWFKKERDALIKALLLNTNHSIREIAKLVNVPESFVLQVKGTL